MGISAIVRVLGIQLAHPAGYSKICSVPFTQSKPQQAQPSNDTEASDTNVVKQSFDLESLTYNVERSTVLPFEHDEDPLTELERFRRFRSDDLFPLALPSHLTSARIADFNPICIDSGGDPKSLGCNVATFCCDVCSYITHGALRSSPYRSANGVGDFHIQLAAYLKNKSVEENEKLQWYYSSNDQSRLGPCVNPRYGHVMTIPRNEVVFYFPYANKEGKGKPSIEVELDTKCNKWYDYIYTVMVYTWEGFQCRSESAMRIIVNNSEAMTPAKFKDFCRL